MGIIILLLIVLVLLTYYYIFYDSKSDLTKIKQSLKEASTEDLTIAKELISNELKTRSI